MDTLFNRVEKRDSLLKRLKFLFACHAKNPNAQAPFHKENRNNNGRALRKNELVII